MGSNCAQAKECEYMHNAFAFLTHAHASVIININTLYHNSVVSTKSAWSLSVVELPWRVLKRETQATKLPEAVGFERTRSAYRSARNNRIYILGLGKPAAYPKVFRRLLSALQLLVCMRSKRCAGKGIPAIRSLQL